ncbi:MAG: DNA repair protein RecO [Thermodesulfobacteriota bacterium]
MAYSDLRAVILAVAESGEADLAVTFLAAQTGKGVGLARGAKKSRRRFLNRLEPFSLVDLFVLDPGRPGWLRIEDAELVTPFLALRQHPERYGAACLLVELTRAWTRTEDEAAGVFALLVWGLARLDAGQSPVHTVTLFALRLLDLVGYRPQLAGCLRCGDLTSRGSPFWFHPWDGGIVCSVCRAGGGDRLTLATVKLLAQAQRLPLAKLDRLHLSEAGEREALAFLEHYHRTLLDRELPAWQGLRQLLGVAAPRTAAG